MGEGREQRWSYPPDYVSAETLAYRLDCSRSTIDAYIRLGLLPKPETIGNLQRWDFGQSKPSSRRKILRHMNCPARHSVKKTCI